MLNLLNISSPVTVNGVRYENSQAAYEALKGFDGPVEVLLGNVQPARQEVVREPEKPAETRFQLGDGKEYRIKVRQYMTKPSEPGFDFMKQHNNDTPMPMRIMYGEVVDETKGMLKMKLHGKPEPSSICLHCGRPLTNPISLLYGIGPECGKHFYINPLGSKEALDAAMDSIRANLTAVTWEGWIIKSAIEEMEEVDI